MPPAKGDAQRLLYEGKALTAGRVFGTYSIRDFGDHWLRYGGHDPGVCACAHGAISRWQIGYPDEAMRLCDEGIELAKQLNHPISIGVAASLSSIVFQYADRPNAILDVEEDGMQSPAHIQFIMRALSGWAKMQLGSVEQGLRECKDAVHGYREVGSIARLSYLSYLLADAQLRAGQPEEALAEIEPACSQMNDVTTRPERIRLMGDVLIRLSKYDLAEKAYFDALNIAHERGARSWELRTAVSLASHWKGQGKRREAQELLAPIYASFTEGFGTPDLKRAKRLLDELA